MIRLAHPWALALVPVAALLLYLTLRRRLDRPATVLFPEVASAARLAPAHWRWRWRAPVLLRAAAILLLAVAAARPQRGQREVEVTSEGIDIVIALDVSGSMKAEDFQPHNRLYVAKEVARRFIEGRAPDRIGMVVFAGESFTQCPLTLDHGILLEFLDQIDFDMMPDGTAIGMGIATATNRLRDAPGASKVVILLTDGKNNAGTVDPITAARAAAAVGVKIYTVAAGREGDAMFPVQDPLFGTRRVRLPSEIDEESLTQIASITGGRFYRATDSEALAQIFRTIGEMEKTRVETREYTEYSDRAPAFLWGALALMVAQLLLADVRWRSFP